MSRILNAYDGTDQNVTIKTGLDPRFVHLNGIRISMGDFLLAVEYALTNTDLAGPNDRRLRFVEWAGTLQETKGYNRGGKRLLGTQRLGQLLKESDEAANGELNKIVDRLNEVGAGMASEFDRMNSATA